MNSSPPSRHHIGIIVVISVMLATVIQMAQIYFPPRQPAMADVVWNALGTGIGILGARLAPNGPLPQWQRTPSADLALPSALLAIWLAAELLPFVPSLDAQLIRNSLKALLHPQWAPQQVVFHVAGVIIAGRALAALTSEARSLRWLLVLAVAVGISKLFIVTRTLDVSTIVGLALGCASWAMIGPMREPRRSTAILLVLFVAYVMGALMPFEMRDIPEPFNYVPFAALLRGSMLANSAALAANLCLYAGILGLIRINGVSPVPSSIAMAMLVFLFEAMQTYLVGRTADITEPLLVLLVGQALRFVSPIATNPRPAVRTDQVQPRLTPSRSPPQSISNSTALRWALQLGAPCVAIALAFAIVLHAPRLPYNVAELFLAKGAFPILVIFALALLWIGGGAYLVGWYTGLSARPWLALPLLLIGAGIISLLLLCASVTQESIGDIAGSNNLYWWVTNRDIWGTWSRNIFLLLPPQLVSFFERPVRYIALYTPLVAFLALIFAFLEMRDRDKLRAMRALPLIMSSALLLWLCKAIAFDWSSTDNLNELIARDGDWGLGGGGYLYALLALVCANAVLLARISSTFSSLTTGTLLTLAMVPVGWWLINMGLEQHVNKYGLVFSGVQFLLGPDRKNLLTPETLFLRWSFVQIAGVLIIAMGARIAGNALKIQMRASSLETPKRTSSVF